MSESRKAPAPEHDAADERPEPRRGASFPIVGVGASAGGLEAFTQLLGVLPPDTGMGFVLVQHLDPDHESALVQILSRATPLPVREIKNDDLVEPNHVYVIPRDTAVSIDKGRLKLEPRQRTRTPHRPVDSFFQSLARDQRDRAVGVVLSGTANDGTLGLEMIKAEGGITFAQDQSAKHDGMPRSAVAAGCVDLVLSPAEIADELARIAKHPYLTKQLLQRSAQDTELRVERERAGDEVALTATKGGPREDGYTKILWLLHNHSGVDFSLYKPATIQRRITRRLVLNKQNTLEDYAGFLRGNAKELDALYSDVLITVTSFFRNPETFEVLEHTILPALLRQHGDDAVRCWVLGCSTGQEAYSIAMAFVEAAEKGPRIRRLQVFATDLNEPLLDKARHGLYAKSIADELTEERLRRFFVEEEGGYRVCKALREMVVFARQNVIDDPPFSRMDLISCRNLLIYFDANLQRQVFPTFHYALRPSGFLLLGASESISGFTDLFEPVDKKHKIFSKKPAQTPMLRLPRKKDPADADGPRTRSSFPHLGSGGHELAEGLHDERNAQREADRITASQFAPPGVLVNAELQVLQFRGPTDAFLELPLGKASFDVLKMAREGLMLPLRSAINQAREDKKATRRENIRFKRHGKARAVNLNVIPLKNLREVCFLIIFEEAAAERAGGLDHAEVGPRDEIASLTADQERSRITELESELSEMREYFQSMQEQHEAANEELQAANEEVQSANEELQSLNEELETSKEELESANEELITVNEEMAVRNVELNQLANDLVNLQTSIKLAIVLLGRDLTIRRFSPQAQKQFDLVVADVGRPLNHIRHNLVLGDAGQPGEFDLPALCAEVISELREQEHEVRDNSGRWYSLRVRPYMTVENKVNGAAMVLVDITALKRSEHAVRESEARYRAMFESTSVGVSEADAETGRLVSVNERFARMLGYSAAEVVGRTFLQLIEPDHVPAYREELSRLVRGELNIYEVETRLVRKDGTTVWVHATVNLVRDALSSSVRTVAITLDISDRKRAEEAQSHLAAIVSSSEDAIVGKDLRGIIQSWNRGAERLFGYTAEEAVGKPATLLIIPVDRVEEEPTIQERTGRGEATEHYETVRRRKDGSLLDVSLTVSPIRDAAGRVTGVAEIARDITERKRLEADLRQRGADLSEADERKNEFLAMLGHELRNPLSALTHGLELLGRVPADHPASKDLLPMMVRQASRIGTLLDQLLDIARIITGKVELSKSHVELAEVVRAAVETVTPLLEARKHKTTVSLPSDESVLVFGDPLRLTQVVENLLTNAAKYTDEGGQIGVALEASEDKACIIVRDTGVGISADFLPRVFEVFTQAPRTLDRAKGGLGLGLPLVRRLVEMHGGRVDVSSPGLGHGSEFVVTLARALERRSNRRHEAAAAPTKHRWVRPYRLLVVDDETDNAEAFASLLQAQGHHVVAVNDGPAALAAVRSFVPEVVLLDLGLPGMDGYEVARRLRQEHRDKKLLLVAVTGYHNDVARLKDSGIDQHLIKPPNMRALSDLLNAWDSAGRAAP